MGTLKLIQISFSSNGDSKAFASQMCLLHDWNSVNGNPPSNICLELICCVTNSGEILKATLEYVLWLEFLQTLQSSISSNYHYVTLIFLKFGKVIAEYYVYKIVFGFPLFLFFYLFKKSFLFQSNTKSTVKDVNQNFTSNKLNDKKHSFVNKLICEYLTP